MVRNCARFRQLRVNVGSVLMISNKLMLVKKKKAMDLSWYNWKCWKAKVWNTDRPMKPSFLMYSGTLDMSFPADMTSQERSFLLDYRKSIVSQPNYKNLSCSFFTVTQSFISFSAGNHINIFLSCITFALSWEETCGDSWENSIKDIGSMCNSTWRK